MTVEMIIVSSDAIERVLDRLASLERKLDAVQITAPPRWITIAEYATKIGRSRRTVTRAIDAGKLAVNDTGPARLVPNPDTERNG